jgi:hypothetical protein
MRRFVIKTKYLGASNVYGARIRVSLPGYKPVTTGYDYEKDFKENCRAAARIFLIKNNVNWVLDNDPVDDGMSSHFFWVASETAA